MITPSGFRRQLILSFHSSLHFILIFTAILLFLAGTGESAHAATIHLSSGGDLQGALNAAQPGDTIILEAGATFTGSFTLPYKAGTGTDADWITIRSSAADSSLPAADERISPAFAPLLPKLISRGQGQPALRTEARAHHYRVVGVEIMKSSADAVVYDLVMLGSWGADQDTLAEVPHHLVFDRCYIHGHPAGDLKRGISLNSTQTEIINSYISEFHVRGQEAQAIGGWNGPGPFKIINNYLEGAGENILFGGAQPDIAQLVPTDIEIRRNHFNKPVNWRGVWTVKNILEMKSGRRVVVDGNVFEHNWPDAQSGYAIAFMPRPNDSGTAAVIEDITFSNNIVRHVSSGMVLTGSDDLYKAGPDEVRGRRIRILNNLFDDIDGDAWGGEGTFLKVGANASYVTVEHNTILHSGSISKSWGDPMPGYVFRNNLLKHNEYGIFGDGVHIGSETLSAYFPRCVFEKNVVVGAEPGLYPRGNFYPQSLEKVQFVNRAGGNYRLAASSPYKGAATDGKDIGCDFNALEAALGTTLQKNISR
jgi:hypothetical protein